MTADLLEEILTETSFLLSEIKDTQKKKIWNKITWVANTVSSDKSASYEVYRLKFFFSRYAKNMEIIHNKDYFIYGPTLWAWLQWTVLPQTQTSPCIQTPLLDGLKVAIALKYSLLLCLTTFQIHCNSLSQLCFILMLEKSEKNHNPTEQKMTCILKRVLLEKKNL